MVAILKPRTATSRRVGGFCATRGDFDFWRNYTSSFRNLKYHIFIIESLRVVSMAEFRDTIDGNVEGLLPNRLTVIRDTRFPETAMSLRGR